MFITNLYCCLSGPDCYWLEAVADGAALFNPIALYSPLYAAINCICTTLYAMIRKSYLKINRTSEVFSFLLIGYDNMPVITAGIHRQYVTSLSLYSVINRWRLVWSFCAYPLTECYRMRMDSSRSVRLLPSSLSLLKRSRIRPILKEPAMLNIHPLS